MRVLVTGGNRYIGLSLVRELAAQGHEVAVLNSHEVALPSGVSRIACDRRVPGALIEALTPYRDAFDVVFDHTAYVVADMLPLIDLFRGRIAHYVFTSSQAVYRRSYVQPLHEEFRRLDPGNDHPAARYGANKVACEDHLLALWESERFPATILRVGHTMGPRSPSATRDPFFFARLEAGRPILIPGDGYAALSLVHVDDVARLMAALIGNEQVRGEAFNVSGAEVTTFVGLVQLIARAMGVRANAVHVPLAAARGLKPPLLHWHEGETGTALLSIEKALATIDWRPRFGIEAGYRDSYEWYAREGRAIYQQDFARDDALLAEFA